jgi:hypothetical protein
VITAKWHQTVKLCFMSQCFVDGDGGRGGGSDGYYDGYVVSSECTSLERLIETNP